MHSRTVSLKINIYINREDQAVVTDSLARTLLLLALYIHHLLQHDEALYVVFCVHSALTYFI